MLNKQSFFYTFIVCTIAPLLCFAESFLTATKFPKTFEDIGFQSKLEFEQEDFIPFQGLNPYQILEIIETDSGIADETIKNEVIFNQDFFLSESEDTSTPEEASNQYCTTNNPSIPKGQKIPLGKPVLRYDKAFFCSKYGWRTISGKDDFHYGFDLGCTLKYYDKPVFVTADGVVIGVYPNSTGSSAGNYIVVQHNNGFRTYYMHLNQMLVKRGQKVQAGCQIATIGNTGGAKANQESFKDNPYPTMRKTISHLHYEIRYTGNQTAIQVGDKIIPIERGSRPNTNIPSVDPRPFLDFQ